MGDGFCSSLEVSLVPDDLEMMVIHMNLNIMLNIFNFQGAWSGVFFSSGAP